MRLLIKTNNGNALLNIKLRIRWHQIVYDCMAHLFSIYRLPGINIIYQNKRYYVLRISLYIHEHSPISSSLICPSRHDVFDDKSEDTEPETMVGYIQVIFVGVQVCLYTCLIATL